MRLAPFRIKKHTNQKLNIIFCSGGGASNRGGRGGYGGGSAGYGGGFQASDNSASAKSARRAGCTKLHVAGLPENCQSSELRRMFERYGYVAECDVVEDRNIAFVHIEDPAAEAAVHGLNGYSIRGVQLKVQFSKNQKNALSGGPGGPAPGGYMQHQGGRQPPHRGAGRPGAYPPNGRPGYGEIQTEGDRSYGAAAEAGYESILPPPAKDRMELLDLLDRRRRLENLDPYERRLIACPDPYNLPPPPPEFIRLLRERALVKARLPLPPSSSALGRALPTAGATTTSSALARAIVARRAAASVAKPDPLHAVAAAHESYADPKAMPYASVYGALTEY